MRVLSLAFSNYRNLRASTFCPAENVNVIYGDNAQGKTNLLEAIWLFTGGRSFRGAKDAELIAFLEKKAVLNLEFFAQNREQTASIDLAYPKRKITLNGVEKKSSAALVGNFCAVVFSPVHLYLVKEGPMIRRKFLDAAICQIKPAYAAALHKYNQTLLQRNSLLKDLRFHADLLDTLEIWEEKLARYGAFLISERLKYCEQLGPHAKQVYAGISDGKEQLFLAYQASFGALEDGENLEQKLFSCLQKKRVDDLAAGYTSVGPHRDDLELSLNGRSVKAFGSQGQQRSCVLALKLAEASILRARIDEKPIILLDDVMSELDVSRQNYLLDFVKDWQVFITCCDASGILGRNDGKKFRIENGEIFT